MKQKAEENDTIVIYGQRRPKQVYSPISKSQSEKGSTLKRTNSLLFWEQILSFLSRPLLISKAKSID